jgi:arabinofuranosyltransferase
MSAGRPLSASVLASAAAVLALVASFGWLCDDAYITLRVADNLWHGYGLRWNVIERVQVFTHPLWMLVVAAVYGVTREAYWTMLGVSLAAVAWLLRVLVRDIAATREAAWVALAVLAGSKAFVAFSTSGLENPLTGLLLVLWLRAVWAPPASASAWAISTLAALVALCRLDLLPMMGPLWLTAIGAVVARDTAGRRQRLAAALLGWWPLAVWLAFAWFYYGTPVPNTAPAKLPQNVSGLLLAQHGGWYVLDALLTDSVTFVTIAAALVHALLTPGRRATGLGLGAGLAVIVTVGGDYMTGRFLTPAFTVAVCYLARHVVWAPQPALAAAGAALAIGIALPDSPLRVWNHGLEHVPFLEHGHGIANERVFYVAQTGVWSQRRNRRPADHPWAVTGHNRRFHPGVYTFGGVGLMGYFGGPGVHLLDPMALTDPLLARLPTEGPWRIGHFPRPLPAGYEDTVRGCLALLFPDHRVAPPDHACIDDPRFVNRIADPTIAAEYQRRAVLAQAALTDPRRLPALLGVSVPR